MSEPQIFSKRTVVIPMGAEGEALRREHSTLREASDLVRRGYRLLELEKMEKAGRFVVHTGDHSLWRHEAGSPPERPFTWAFGVTEDFGIRWYSPAVDANGQLLTIDAVLEMDRAAEERARKAEAERKAEADERRKSATVVTLDDLRPGPEMTLREAGDRVDRAGGKLEVKGDRLVVSLPGSGRGGWSGALAAAERLYLAEEVVLGCLSAKRRLPDKLVLPSGALAP